MEKLLIEGGNRLDGTVPISGAKNAALPIMAASLLCSEPVELNRVPNLRDIRTLTKILATLGVEVERKEEGLRLDSSGVTQLEAPYDLVRKMRASVLVLGPLLARWGEARVSLPGGCAIGARPVDIHLDGLRALGADIEIDHGYIHATASRLTGADIYLDFPSVGATENLMMAAVLARGTTTLENAAREPEIADLADFLNRAGASIEGAGSDSIRIEGTDRLHGTKHSILEDRIEAGTYLTAGAITRGRVRLENVRPGLFRAVLHKLREAGCSIEVDGSTIELTMDRRPEPTDVVTRPFPGFPTDMQAQFMALMCLARGTSQIKETIFEDRFTHVNELERLGADIKIDSTTVTVEGGNRLDGAPVMASDLRASAALVVAGLVAKGNTEVLRVYHLDRGYENLESKLNNIGASIRRIPQEKSV